MEIEMFVKLIVPDNTAVTAKNTLRKLGYKLDDLKRYDYYYFETDADIKDKLAKVDILVNANKHRVSFVKCEGVNILVSETREDLGLLNTLTNRLAFKGIKKIKKGTVWEFIGCSDKEAISMTKELLVNENYQSFEIL